jgi:predicted acetyltransferase
VIEIHPLTDADLPSLRRIDDLAFGVTQSDARWEAASPQLERNRQIGAFDGSRLVGHAGALTHSLTVPGGVVPAAGVTWVMVDPTYRRRGILRSLMQQQLGDLHEHGEAVATLWASEPMIYPRFGYGQASRRLGLTVPRPYAAMRPGPSDGVTLTVGSVPDLRERYVRVYEALRPQVPGLTSRSPDAWVETAFDDTTPSTRGSLLRCVVAADESGAPVGYAWFQTTQNWDDGVPGGTATVHEIASLTPQATRALLDFVLTLDLSSTTEFWNLPVDHPLLWLLVDARRSRKALLDGLWVRLVRLDEALAERGYATDVDVVLDVADRSCGWNEGRWRLAAGPGGAEVSRTDDPADLVLDIADLGAAYLGDPTVLPGIAGGAIEERTPGAGLALHRAMRGDRAPWTAYIF